MAQAPGAAARPGETRRHRGFLDRFAHLVVDRFGDQFDDSCVGFFFSGGLAPAFFSGPEGEPGAGFAGSPLAAATLAACRSRTAESSSSSFFCSSAVSGGVSRGPGHALTGRKRGCSAGRGGASAGKPPAAAGRRSIAPVVEHAVSDTP